MPAIKRTSTNPRWSRDEIILVLHLYVQKKGVVSEALEKIYSKHLIDLAMMNGILVEKYENFRSPDSINLRIRNFISGDSNPPNTKGLSGGGGFYREIQNEFKNNFSELEKEAKKILSRINKFQKPIKEELYEAHVNEGGIRLFRHKSRERNAKIVSDKKKKPLKKRGFYLARCVNLIF